MISPSLHCSTDAATWSAARDGIVFPAQDGSLAVTVIVTRAAAAALDGKDQSEISADAALALFTTHSATIGRIAETAYHRRAAAELIIDYAEIEAGA